MAVHWFTSPKKQNAGRRNCMLRRPCMRLAIIRTVLWSLLAPFLLLAGATELNAVSSTNVSSIVHLEVPGIRNAFKVSENLFSGS